MTVLKVPSRVPSALRRAMKLLVWPPTVVNSPPTRILPSACITMVLTAALAFGLKALSRPPSALSRAIPLRVWPSMLIKLPPARTLPSACTAMARTTPLTSIEVAREPSIGLSSWRLVKRPPTRIQLPRNPSVGAVIAETQAVPSPAHEIKALSVVPSPLSRATRHRGCPPMLENPPPTRILPSGWTAVARTKASALGLLLASRVPSA